MHILWAYSIILGVSWSKKKSRDDVGAAERGSECFLHCRGHNSAASGQSASWQCQDLTASFTGLLKTSNYTIPIPFSTPFSRCHELPQDASYAVCEPGMRYSLPQPLAQPSTSPDIPRIQHVPLIVKHYAQTQSSQCTVKATAFFPKNAHVLDNMFNG